jgi:hypothetical protein
MRVLGSAESDRKLSVDAVTFQYAVVVAAVASALALVAIRDSHEQNPRP